MIKFEDQEYAKHLLLLAERIKNAPNLIKTLPQEELLQAWRWIDDKVFLRTGDNIVIVVTHETNVLRRLFDQIKSEITRRDSANPNGEQVALTTHVLPSNKTPKPSFMNKKYIVIALFAITLLLIWAVYSGGGKMMALRNLFSYERNNVPSAAPQPEGVVSPSPLITLTGTITLNGQAPRNGEIMQVYLKDNTLVQPVTPDGNAFVLKGVPIPENNFVRLALDLQNGQRVSQQFQLPAPKNGISDLGECIFSSSQVVGTKLPTSNPNTALLKHNQNPDNNEKIQLNNPTFNGPTQIGGKDNTQINQFGPKPREVSDSLIAKIKSYAPNKNTPIGVARRSQDSESYEYATKIVNALIGAGYKNAFVNGIVYDPIIGGDPNVAAKQQREIGFKMEEGQLNIALPSNQ